MKNFSRKGAKEQRKALAFLAGFAPLREMFSVQRGRHDYFGGGVSCVAQFPRDH